MIQSRTFDTKRDPSESTKVFQFVKLYSEADSDAEAEDPPLSAKIKKKIQSLPSKLDQIGSSSSSSSSSGRSSCMKGSDPMPRSASVDKNLRFGSVTTDYFKLTLGDNPSVTRGFPTRLAFEEGPVLSETRPLNEDRENVNEDQENASQSTNNKKRFTPWLLLCFWNRSHNNKQQAPVFHGSQGTAPVISHKSIEKGLGKSGYSELELYSRKAKVLEIQYARESLLKDYPNVNDALKASEEANNASEEIQETSDQ